MASCYVLNEWQMTFQFDPPFLSKQLFNIATSTVNLNDSTAISFIVTWTFIDIKCSLQGSCGHLIRGLHEMGDVCWVTSVGWRFFEILYSKGSLKLSNIACVSSFDLAMHLWLLLFSLRTEIFQRATWNFRGNINTNPLHNRTLWTYPAEWERKVYKIDGSHY